MEGRKRENIGGKYWRKGMEGRRGGIRKGESEGRGGGRIILEGRGGKEWRE